MKIRNQGIENEKIQTKKTGEGESETLYSKNQIGQSKVVRSDWFFEKRINCEWLSTKEAAHFLSISENALRILVHRGKIPVFKFGSRLRFKHSDCQALFQKKGT